MLRRPSAWIVVALLASGCQDYNFNPVGHCLLQPGSERITLSSLATADILFVVDDSGSMKGEQENLAANFETFVNELTQTNLDRIARNLSPLEFHIAITTTSVFEATSRNTTCRTDCGGAGGELACCSGAGAAPLAQPVYCQTNAECGAGYTCQSNCPNFPGELVCCNSLGAAQVGEAIACRTEGEICGAVRDRYRGGCTDGVGSPGAPYPAGDFVRVGSNPRVISFDEAVYPETGGVNEAALAERIRQFQENIKVGTCGSGQEQALEAARLAVKKALGMDGLSQPPDFVPGSWPHPDSKLVVVYVGDEDDCSTPRDNPLVLPLSGGDVCVADVAEIRRYSRQEYVNFFRGLGRPIGMAFVESMTQSNGDWVPGVCCGAPDNACTGSESPGYRFTKLADDFRTLGVEVVEGSVCADFGATLAQIAELVKPPTGLTLPTQPAATEVAVLRIAGPDGETRKTCVGPAPVGTPASELNNYDWWFTATSQSTTPSEASRFIYINHDTHNCEANPGETYSADYLGVVPEGGVPGTFYTPEDGSPECAQALGGNPSDWTWHPVPGLMSGATQLGTCVCR